MGRRTLVAALVVAGLALAGCGSSGGDSTSTAATKAAAPSTATTAPTATTPAPNKNPAALKTIKRRLHHAGLFPVDVDLGSGEDAAVEVRHVDVVAFKNAADASAYEGSLKSFFHPHPKGGTFKRFGKLLYWTGDEQALTAAQLANFHRIVRVGQGH